MLRPCCGLEVAEARDGANGREDTGGRKDVDGREGAGVVDFGFSERCGLFVDVDVIVFTDVPSVSASPLSRSFNVGKAEAMASTASFHFDSLVAMVNTIWWFKGMNDLSLFFKSRDRWSWSAFGLALS